MVPGLLLAAKRDRVLVVGSSEGVASQISAAAGAAHVDHVDIDEECVRACAEHLPYGYDTDELERAQAHTGNVRVHFTDGYEFVRSCAGSGTEYDLVVVDLPDEVPGEGSSTTGCTGRSSWSSATRSSSPPAASWPSRRDVRRCGATAPS